VLLPETQRIWNATDVDRQGQRISGAWEDRVSGVEIALRLTVFRDHGPVGRVLEYQFIHLVFGRVISPSPRGESFVRQLLQ
jgi:hypothetical protein